MSHQIQFRISNDDYEKLTSLSAGQSPNIKAREVFLDALYSQDKNTDYALKLIIRNLTMTQRMIQKHFGDEGAGEVYKAAQEDEGQYLGMVGLNNG